ncbi:hypothetical protein QFZ99_000903 [Paraburkholderia atlantica]|uniref:hypothetical protein n=1 Tax=Paraburkholderia atlantica TaxID=2654982 RepID=UPI003D199BDF
MNDVRPASPLLFTLPTQTEKVKTENFGTVLISELPVPLLTKFFEQHADTKDPVRMGYALICECVTGEHGERFTIATIDALPGRAMRDLTKMIDAAQRVNGFTQGAVEKASPLP